MAGFTPVHPATPTTDVSIAPTPSVEYYTLDYINSIAASTGYYGIQQNVIRTVSERATIIDIGPLSNSGTEQTFAVETDSEINNGNQLRNALRLLSQDGIDLTSATVNARNLWCPV